MRRKFLDYESGPGVMGIQAQTRPGDSRSATFFAPSLKRYETDEFAQTGGGCFAAVSLTGAECSLMCDHCRAQILSWMRSTTTPEGLLEAARHLQAEGAAGLLVSGGSDRQGVVPLQGFLPAIKQIREGGLRVMVHTGVTSPELAAGLAAAGVDAALIDIIGEAETIRRVCHLQQGPAAYESSLSNLIAAGVPVAPHVVIGLDHGRLGGEENALMMIAHYPVTSVVLVGLLPLPGTPMSAAVPPPPEQFGRIFRRARELFPDTPVMLGCERPAGRHKEETDRLALAAGLDGIAFPAEGTISHARRLGLHVSFSESCCALVAAGGGQ